MCALVTGVQTCALPICFILVGFGSEVDAQIRYRETTLANATAHALDAVAMLGGRGGCIAIDARGKIALPFNSSAMFRAWFGEDGEIGVAVGADRSEEHTSELQSLMRISYAVFCLKQKKKKNTPTHHE